MNKEKQIEICQTVDDQAEIEVRLEADTVWLTQAKTAPATDRISGIVIERSSGSI